MKPIPSPAPSPAKDGFVVIDARGHRCPVPTLKLRQKIEALQDEAGFILWANDPMAQIDVPHFCNQNNHVLISTEVVDEAWLFTIARAGR
ncbi:sulfurtransferase TusA family protein [Asticcacaulis taihuensis]|uniref:sulfurtransferase TusA family protein n=1 Tax=Asticcacaulis taihuensis TaxID=260084 RepID=UPI003F7C112A